MQLFWILVFILIAISLNSQFEQANCMASYNQLFSKCQKQTKGQQNLQLQSFIFVSNNSQFPLENIPFGVFSTKQKSKRPGTRIGDWVIDLQILEKKGLLNTQLIKNIHKPFFAGENLNEFMSLSRPFWKQVREKIQQLFSKGSQLQNNKQLLSLIVLKYEECTMYLPCNIGDFTDFYSSKNHAFNIGSIIRGQQNALNPNWVHIPIAYHGRSSSIVKTGTKVRRPRGQIKHKNQSDPVFEQSKKVDFEVQIAAFVGGATNQLGKPIKIKDAWNNIFGFVLLNDWSFRDLQTWQYVPLGPFTSKNGVTTISPWVVTLQTLQGYQTQLQKQNPPPLKYLQEQKHYSYDIKLQTSIKTKKMEDFELISQTNFKYLYWSCAQQLVHHTVSGCKMRPGDLLGSGTISGTTKQSYGSMFQITKGENPIILKNNEKRIFLQNEDMIRITGYAEKNGKKIGFGECSGQIIAALEESQYF